MMPEDSVWMTTFLSLEEQQGIGKEYRNIGFEEVHLDDEEESLNSHIIKLKF
jgi:hypothetical protein